MTTTKMTTQDSARRLRLLILAGIINPDDFYTINVYRDSLQFQGDATSRRVKYFAESLKLKYDLCSNGYINFSKTTFSGFSYRIVLTHND